MPRVKIKQMDERVSCSGLHFGQGPLVPKLEPGEVVEIPDGKLFDQLWATGKLELTPEPVTRPLKYQTADEARYCSPSYVAREPSDERDCQNARDAVAKRLKAAGAARDGDSPPADERLNSSEPDEPDTAPADRRARRRAAIAASGEHAEVSS